MVTLGNWSDEMVLFFNQVGMYCEENGFNAAEAREMFEHGIAKSAAQGVRPVDESGLFVQILEAKG